MTELEILVIASSAVITVTGIMSGIIGYSLGRIQRPLSRKCSP